jgi:hypothetical protein
MHWIQSAAAANVQLFSLADESFQSRSSLTNRFRRNMSSDSRRSPSSPTGPATPRPRCSSATIRCWTFCRSASLSSPAPASRRTLPTRPRSSASPSGSSARAARERRRYSANSETRKVADQPEAEVRSTAAWCQFRTFHPTRGRAGMDYAVAQLPQFGLRPPRFSRRLPRC